MSKASAPVPQSQEYSLSPAQFRFLEVLQVAEHNWSITRICREAGIHRASYYRWQREPGFAYQIGKLAFRHVAVSAPMFFARGMNSALTGDNKIWHAMFRFLTTPRAMDLLNANLEALARFAAAEGGDCTRAWDNLREIGPHHRTDARERLVNTAQQEDPVSPELEDFYSLPARDILAAVPAPGPYSDLLPASASRQALPEAVIEPEPPAAPASHPPDEPPAPRPVSSETAGLESALTAARDRSRSFLHNFGLLRKTYRSILPPFSPRFLGPKLA